MKLQKTSFLGIAGIVLISALHLGVPQSKPLQFEVASVKPNASGDHRIMMQITAGGRLNVTGASLRDLIRTAYGIEDFQIIGGSAWISSERWDIQAKAEENVLQSQVTEMLQSLLAERFQLKFHKESRRLPVYELVIARNGPKLQESKPNANGDGHNAGPRQSHGAGGHAGGRAMTMAQLAQMLSVTVDRTVLDKTGLAGTYDITLSWRPEPGQGRSFGNHMPPGGALPASDPGLPSIFTAVQDQLGLKLEAARGPVDVIVIDSAQKPTQQ